MVSRQGVGSPAEQKLRRSGRAHTRRRLQGLGIRPPPLLFLVYASNIRILLFLAYVKNKGRVFHTVGKFVDVFLEREVA